MSTTVYALASPAPVVYACPAALHAAPVSFWSPGRPQQTKHLKPYVRPQVVPLTGSGRLRVSVKATGTPVGVRAKAAGAFSVRRSVRPLSGQYLTPDLMLLDLLLEDW